MTKAELIMLLEPFKDSAEVFIAPLNPAIMTMRNLSNGQAQEITGVGHNRVAIYLSARWFSGETTSRIVFNSESCDVCKEHKV